MKPKIVDLNVESFDINEWSKWEIIAHQVKEFYGKTINDVSILGLGKFLEDSEKILDKQIRKLNRKKKK